MVLRRPYTLYFRPKRKPFKIFLGCLLFTIHLSWPIILQIQARHAGCDDNKYRQPHAEMAVYLTLGDPLT
jgi:hypothetical protein